MNLTPLCFAHSEPLCIHCVAPTSEPHSHPSNDSRKNLTNRSGVLGVQLHASRNAR